MPVHADVRHTDHEMNDFLCRAYAHNIEVFRMSFPYRVVAKQLLVCFVEVLMCNV